MKERSGRRRSKQKMRGVMGKEGRNEKGRGGGGGVLVTGGQGEQACREGKQGLLCGRCLRGGRRGLEECGLCDLCSQPSLIHQSDGGG